MTTYLENRGHTAIHRNLESLGCIKKDVFLLLPPAPDGKSAGWWISRKSFTALPIYEHIFQKRKHQKTLFLNVLMNIKISGDISDSIGKSLSSQSVPNNVLSFVTAYNRFGWSHICGAALLVVLDNCCLASKDERDAIKILRDDMNNGIILSLVDQKLVQPINGSWEVQNKKKLARFVCD